MLTFVDIELRVRPSSKFVVRLDVTFDHLVPLFLTENTEELLCSFDGLFDWRSFIVVVFPDTSIWPAIGRESLVGPLDVGNL